MDPRVKLNNQNAAYLEFILLILIELGIVGFFFSFLFKFGFGNMPLREMTTIRDGSRTSVTHLRALVENVTHFLNQCPFPKIFFSSFSIRKFWVSPDKWFILMSWTWVVIVFLTVVATGFLRI